MLPLPRTTRAKPFPQLAGTFRFPLSLHFLQYLVLKSRWRATQCTWSTESGPPADDTAHINSELTMNMVKNNRQHVSTHDGASQDVQKRRAIAAVVIARTPMAYVSHMGTLVCTRALEQSRRQASPTNEVV